MREYGGEYELREETSRGLRLATSMSNLCICLRDAGMLARAWNLGTQNGALWATGRVVLRRFGPEAP